MTCSVVLRVLLSSFYPLCGAPNPRRLHKQYFGYWCQDPVVGFDGRTSGQGELLMVSDREIGMLLRGQEMGLHNEPQVPEDKVSTEPLNLCGRGSAIQPRHQVLSSGAPEAKILFMELTRIGSATERIEGG
ncbi:hypothetical protein DFH07DRAFT_776066 [Mycena maculata]|uniref:Uncharacterized protein n=1 Tax=Mycena maculata TaxID=230809 RepID=A0AAD7INE3_9AGAR|nr:hypothetical protein DFH07DRAFT_776066 [Mycena maculata]